MSRSFSLTLVAVLALTNTCDALLALVARRPTSAGSKCACRATVICNSAKLPGRIGGSSGDWHVERARLQHKHEQQIRTRKARYPRFATSSNIVQMQGLSTKEEYFEWLEQGEGLSPYVPRDPERYYKERGEWLGWRAWLTGGV